MKNSVKYNGKLNVIGEKIKQYRELNNLSQAQLSNRLQLLGIYIPKNSIQKIENGKRTIHEYELAGLSKILKVSTDKLLEEFLKDGDIK